jgi:hypothetical protein
MWVVLIITSVTAGVVMALVGYFLLRPRTVPRVIISAVSSPFPDGFVFFAKHMLLREARDAASLTKSSVGQLRAAWQSLSADETEHYNATAAKEAHLWQVLTALDHEHLQGSSLVDDVVRLEREAAERRNLRHTAGKLLVPASQDVRLLVAMHR